MKRIYLLSLLIFLVTFKLQSQEKDKQKLTEKEFLHLSYFGLKGPVKSIETKKDIYFAYYFNQNFPEYLEYNPSGYCTKRMFDPNSKTTYSYYNDTTTKEIVDYSRTGMITHSIKFDVKGNIINKKDSRKNAQCKYLYNTDGSITKLCYDAHGKKKYEIFYDKFDRDVGKTHYDTLGNPIYIWKNTYHSNGKISIVEGNDIKAGKKSFSQYIYSSEKKKIGKNYWINDKFISSKYVVFNKYSDPVAEIYVDRNLKSTTDYTFKNYIYDDYENWTSRVVNDTCNEIRNIIYYE